jgi:hypothetical protein
MGLATRRGYSGSSHVADGELAGDRQLAGSGERADRAGRHYRHAGGPLHRADRHLAVHHRAGGGGLAGDRQLADCNGPRMNNSIDFSRSPMDWIATPAKSLIRGP